MKGKVELLMEETGCERGEAELALEMCGYEVGGGGRKTARLPRDSAAAKVKFAAPAAPKHAAALVGQHPTRPTRHRCRALFSSEPTVWAMEITEDWFACERPLFGSRLRGGSLP